jgi:multiple antibiotic resistance protein
MSETSFSILSTALLLTFVLDPFGNIPVLLSLLRDMDERRRYRIIIREVLIGLAILLMFLFLGDSFLRVFHLETEAVTIAGGIIFFIFGIRMIFPDEKGSAVFPADADPLVVPIALPMIAGPSALATLLVLSNNHPGKTLELFYALLLAWVVSALFFLAAPLLYKVLKDKGLTAMERLMGMLLLIMSVQMFINGLRGVMGAGQ